MNFGKERKIFHVDDAQCLYGRFSADPIKICVVSTTNEAALISAKKIKSHFQRYGCDVKGPIDLSNKKKAYFKKIIYLKNFDSIAIRSAMSLTFSADVSFEIQPCE